MVGSLPNTLGRVLEPLAFPMLPQPLHLGQTPVQTLQQRVDDLYRDSLQAQALVPDQVLVTRTDPLTTKTILDWAPTPQGAGAALFGWGWGGGGNGQGPGPA